MLRNEVSLTVTISNNPTLVLSVPPLTDRRAIPGTKREGYLTGFDLLKNVLANEHSCCLGE